LPYSWTKPAPVVASPAPATVAVIKEESKAEMKGDVETKVEAGAIEDVNAVQDEGEVADMAQVATEMGAASSKQVAASEARSAVQKKWYRAVRAVVRGRARHARSQWEGLMSSLEDAHDDLLASIEMQMPSADAGVPLEHERIEMLREEWLAFLRDAEKADRGRERAEKKLADMAAVEAARLEAERKVAKKAFKKKHPPRKVKRGGKKVNVGPQFEFIPKTREERVAEWTEKKQLQEIDKLVALEAEEARLKQLVEDMREQAQRCRGHATVVDLTVYNVEQDVRTAEAHKYTVREEREAEEERWPWIQARLAKQQEVWIVSKSSLLVRLFPLAFSFCTILSLSFIFRFPVLLHSCFYFACMGSDLLSPRRRAGEGGGGRGPAGLVCQESKAASGCWSKFTPPGGVYS
jgi:hypothetical protein